MGTEDGNFTMKHKANLKIARYPSTEGGVLSGSDLDKVRGKGRRCFVPSRIHLSPFRMGRGKGRSLDARRSLHLPTLSRNQTVT